MMSTPTSTPYYMPQSVTCQGEVSFYVGTECEEIAPGAWYGQRLAKDYEVDIQVEEAPYGRHQVRRHVSGAKSITVTAITLVSILDGLDQVDLIDSDLQGAELGVIRSFHPRVGRKSEATSHRDAWPGNRKRTPPVVDESRLAMFGRLPVFLAGGDTLGSNRISRRRSELGESIAHRTMVAAFCFCLQDEGPIQAPARLGLDAALQR